jgi:environmental stress-induced protein Ves
MENIPRVIRYRDYPVTPWKNQRGVTREVVGGTANSDGSNFDWRISMAEINEDAPFSRYPGIERKLAVVAGGELELTIEGATQRLGIGAPAVTFSGEATVSGRPVGDPVTDLNLMFDPTLGLATLEPVVAGHFAAEVGAVIVVALGPGADVRVRWAAEDAFGCELGSLDALVMASAEPLTFEIESTDTSRAEALAYVARVFIDFSAR